MTATTAAPTTAPMANHSVSVQEPDWLPATLLGEAVKLTETVFEVPDSVNCPDVGLATNPETAPTV